MRTDYDPIAERYKRAKLQPWRNCIETFTLLDLIGNLSGQAVVDVACGEGFYTRRLRAQGAARVLGVDLSERMVELAREQETEQPLGIDYRVGDGKNLSLPSEFDLAVAAYLLNYAADRHELGAMCAGISACLRPGGRFVTVNSNPAMDFSALPSYRRYGFDTRVAGEIRQGMPVTWTFFLEDGPLEIENYYLDVPAHEAAFRAAGFREIRWHAPRLSPEGKAEFGEDFWADFLDHPPVIFIECLK
ncbi:class I SAM-dependent methyltransferase [Methylococcus mesophilus]|uniref:class I SAM-dependent methyltransferase n=1 Tax=Methylococcus mesophilus TaxID=2993564 RepID=UPI00224A89C5|nr:class I SAM-dependent methyltransferase [Methylococcus mesophilus]UZR30852.1 class I SAM-dependent methyltransferase [Methylococcus mesophilus]